MSSRTAAGRKRLQQPKAQKTGSSKPTESMTFSSDVNPPTQSSPSPVSPIMTSASPNQAPFQRSDRPSNAQDNAAATPSSSHLSMPYPSPPESRENIYHLSPTSSFVVPHTMSVLEGFTHDPLLFRTESGPERSVPVSILSPSAIDHQGYRKYPSPPPSNSDPLSPLSLSPVSTDHPSLPRLTFSESSSDFTSIKSSNMDSPSSLVANASSSIFSFPSGSDSSESVRLPSHPQKPGFVYPGSRSLGRPSPGGPKFRFKPRNKGKELDSGVKVEERGYSQRPHTSRQTIHLPDGRIMVAGPSSISAPSLRSSRSLNSSTSSGGSIKRSDPGFVFPTTRSRAHPGVAPRNSRKKLEHTGAEVTKKFMGISLNRKKKGSLNSQSPTTTESLSPIVQENRYFEPTTPTDDVFEEPSPTKKRDITLIPKILPRLTYPFDPYESALLESDKHTDSLLRRLNSNDTPSFIQYGNDPPSSILDLGCGQGHWILEAAIHWKGYGTQVTGFDLADIMKSIHTLAMKHGVSQNIKLVRGNFLKQPLPFANESFDLVRMANLTYAISYDKWDFVLREVCRVLTIGGRLELIDDHIFFPAALPTALSLTTHDSQRTQEQWHYEVGKTDDDASDTATLRGGHPSPRAALAQNATAAPSAKLPLLDVESQFWAEQMDASRELEKLFEHMMNLKFGIHLCPSEFLPDMLSQIFGHSREIATMHLTIALPESLTAGTNAFPRNSTAVTSMNQSSTNTIRSPPSSGGTSLNPSIERGSLELSPGLVLWPSTLIPMSHTELQAHALKHHQSLLSSKAVLVEYAVESLDIEDDDMIMEAMWEYEGFLNLRLSPLSQRAEGLSFVSDFQNHPSHSNRDSMCSVSSATSSVMWDYDFELRHHFAWPQEDPSTKNDPDTFNAYPSPTSVSVERPAASTPHFHESLDRKGRGQNLSLGTETIIPDVPSSFSHTRPAHLQSAGRESLAPPDYSETDPVHVRTFHIYEAIKLDPSLFSPM